MRDWTGFFGPRPGTSARDPGGRPAAEGATDPISEAVRTAYRVVDEQLRRAQEEARRMSEQWSRPTGGVNDAQAAAEQFWRATSDVAYFSPERALGGSVGLRGEMRIYRRYDIGVDQSLTGRLGFYDQQGFSAGNTWSLDYLLSAGFTPRWHGYVGFSRSSHPYDGVQEYATFFLAGFGGRF